MNWAERPSCLSPITHEWTICPQLHSAVWGWIRGNGPSFAAICWAVVKSTLVPVGCKIQQVGPLIVPPAPSFVVVVCVCVCARMPVCMHTNVYMQLSESRWNSYCYLRDGERVETVSDFIFGGLQNHCRW